MSVAVLELTFSLDSSFTAFTSTRHHSFLLGSLPISLNSTKRASSFFIKMSSSALKRDMILRRPSRYVTRQSQSVIALIVAVRRASTGFLQSAAISPKTAPSDRVQTRLPPMRTSTSPRWRMYMLSPYSPSVMMSTPGVNKRWLTCSAMASTNFGLHCLKIGTSLMEDFMAFSSSIRTLCIALSPSSASCALPASIRLRCQERWPVTGFSRSSRLSWVRESKRASVRRFCRFRCSDFDFVSTESVPLAKLGASSVSVSVLPLARVRSVSVRALRLDGFLMSSSSEAPRVTEIDMASCSNSLSRS
mmetsp:Transcript_57457/g.134547  ORF Transcript_57457/g.134547 Transcript_57457/m.134547 type:complete len:304 (+) Transcript_57457:769-1680(+)